MVIERNKVAGRENCGMSCVGICHTLISCCIEEHSRIIKSNSVGIISENLICLQIQSINTNNVYFMYFIIYF